MESTKKGGFFKDWILPIIMAVVLASFIKAFIFQTTKVEGLSMYPTFDEGDLLICSKIPYYFNSPKRGDIIIFTSPYDNGQAYIKRVIGQGGDDVRIENGHFYINGELLEEDYIDDDVVTQPAFGSTNHWKVGEGEFFAIGDNRGNSTDGRNFGTLSKDKVIGKVVFRFWPLNRIGVMGE